MHNRFIFSTFHKFYYYALFIYIIIFIFFTYGYFKLPEIQEKFQKTVLSLSIDNTDKIADETISFILKDETSFISSHIASKQVRKKHELALSRLKRGNISSVFIVFLQKEALVYLLDVSDRDRGSFGELFQAEEMSLFRKMIDTKEKEIFIQKGIKNLGFTLVKPIVEKDNVVAFLLLDYQQKSLDMMISKVIYYMNFLKKFYL